MQQDKFFYYSSIRRIILDKWMFLLTFYDTGL